MEILLKALPEIIGGLVVAILITLIGYFSNILPKLKRKTSMNGEDCKTLISLHENYYLLIDLKNDVIKRNVSGKSSGLAFSLKFAQKVFQKATGTELNYSVAATGIVDEPTKYARVKKVAGINEKFRAALECLKNGDKLFFPAENESEIEPSLRKDIINIETQ